MRRSQYKKIRQELEASLAEAEINVTAIQRRLEALDVVWQEIICKGEKGEQATPRPRIDQEAQVDWEEDISAVSQDLGDGVHATTGALVEAMIETFDEPFSVKQVERCIRDGFPGVKINRSTISGRLKRLAEIGKLLIVEKGKGRKPSLYKYKKEAKAA